MSEVDTTKPIETSEEQMKKVVDATFDKLECVWRKSGGSLLKIVNDVRRNSDGTLDVQCGVVSATVVDGQVRFSLDERYKTV